MRILVFPHDFGIGGSQLNAVEIASTIRDMGHECFLFGRPGPLNDRVANLDLEFIEAPRPRIRPTPRIIKSLVETIDRHRIDILHGYEWPPTLECAIASALRPKTRCVSTVMSMSVAAFIPNTVPLLVGTEAIADYEKSLGRLNTFVQEPPVDLNHNNPNIDAGQELFRRKWGIDPDVFTAVIVSRLAPELKLEGILAAIDSMALVKPGARIQLVIVGDGSAKATVERAAQQANANLTKHKVILTGELNDPRAAYSVADVVLGMGGSALRGLAFGKPLIVQGEEGYWKLLTETSLPDFRWHGWYGRGNDAGSGANKLAQILDQLMAAESLRQELGKFALETIHTHYSLTKAAQIQLMVYEQAMEAERQLFRGVGQGIKSASKLIRYETQRRWSEFHGNSFLDDFNSHPIVSRRPDSHEVGAS